MKKRRKPGTACAGGKRCIGIYDYTRTSADGEPKTYRLCTTHLADWMMGDYVKATEGCCRYCGSQRDLQWAHVFRRSYRATRWLYEPQGIQGSMALCQTHHMMFTENPAKWEQWCRDVDVPWDELRRRSLNDPPMDPLEVVLTLKERQT